MMNAGAYAPIYFEKFELLLQTELFNNGAIALFVARLQIFQMSAAVGDHLQKAAARVLVFQMFLQMRRKFFNALAQNGNLDLR